MHNYEIRIIARNFEAARIVVITQANDFAAIRKACSLTRIDEDQGIEIWRGLDCIYADYRHQPLSAC